MRRREKRENRRKKTEKVKEIEKGGEERVKRGGKGRGREMKGKARAQTDINGRFLKKIHQH